jgi:hypothetical protein
MKNRRSNKNSKVKTFLFFLLLAILFWGLTKLSRDYTSSAKVQIEYTNIPEGIEVDENNPRLISFDLTANGYEFLMYKLAEPKLKIDVNSLYSEGTDKISIRKEQLHLLLATTLKKSYSISNISKNELEISLSKIVSKRVPVIGKTNFTYKEGYGTKDSLVVKPDSVKISGPSYLLKDIGAVFTKTISKTNIDQDISMLVPLLLPESKKVALDLNEVLVQLDVTEYSQMQLAVPVEIINVPSDLTVKIIPEIVRITFIISVDEFNLVAAKDFKIICDYNERNIANNSMKPKLVLKPKHIQKVEFLDKTIDFLIFK